MSDLRNAAQQALEALDSDNPEIQLRAAITLRAALEQEQEDWSRVDALEASLREHMSEIHRLRATLEREQAEPEPVAWMCPDDPERETAFNWKAGHCENCGKQRIPLYTAPPQRKPLTEEEIYTCFHAARNAKLGAAQDNSKHRLSVVEIARAVELSHGIGEEV